MVDVALKLRLRTVGHKATSTLGSRDLRANILDRLGRYDEALGEARATVQAQKDSPALGPLHWNTVDTRLLLGRILFNIGKFDESLGPK